MEKSSDRRRHGKIWLSVGQSGDLAELTSVVAEELVELTSAVAEELGEGMSTGAVGKEIEKNFQAIWRPSEGISVWCATVAEAKSTKSSNVERPPTPRKM